MACQDGKVLGSKAPGTASAQYVAASVDHQATFKPRRRATLPVALEQIGDQRPLGIGQIDVHATGTINTAMHRGIAIALGRRVLNSGA